MFYKHWKKIALALTSFFWSSCDNGTSANNPEEPSSSSITPSSSAAQSSASTTSSATANSSSATNPPATSSSSIASSSLAASSSSVANISSAASSSSQKVKSSSSSKPIQNSSNSLLHEITEDLYGCPSDICGQISSSVEQQNSSSSSAAAKPNCSKYETDNTLTCDNGVSCKEEVTEAAAVPECNEEICPKYGVVIIKEKTYKCSDGKTYNEAEFKASHDITEFHAVVAKYGMPTPEITAKYGIPTPEK